MMVDLLPPGLLGLMIASFLAAFMSTFRRLPISISQFLDDLDHQRLRLNTDLTEDHKSFIRTQNHLRAMVVFSVVWIILGGVLLYLDHMRFDWRRWPAYLCLGFGVSLQFWVFIRGVSNFLGAKRASKQKRKEEKTDETQEETGEFSFPTFFLRN